MFDYDKRRKMTERPEEEPKFSTKNQFDKRIVSIVLISLAIVAVLIAGVICIYYFVL